MGKNCLLIDDDKDDQEIFLMAMEKTGLAINCTAMTDSVEAVEMLSKPSFHPEFIFIDINMPKMNGLECLSRINTFEHLHGAKIIMYSTSTDQDIIRQCKDLGAKDFLVKPPGLMLLVASLTNILKQDQGE
jgi:CheY-like chemotaxis protein